MLAVPKQKLIIRYQEKKIVLRRVAFRDKMPDRRALRCNTRSRVIQTTQISIDPERQQISRRFYGLIKPPRTRRYFGGTHVIRIPYIMLYSELKHSVYCAVMRPVW